MCHSIAFHAKMMGDIMFFHRALKQPDAAEFVKALIKEVNGHIENKRWKLVKQAKTSDDIDGILSGCQRGRNSKKNHEVSKYMSRLNT